MNLINQKGVDISYAQDDIDLSKVKAAGYCWVMIRVGQGTRITDNWFATNVAKAEKLGMPWGVYLLTEATTTAAAQAEVSFADKLIKAQIAKGYKPTLPIAIDIEEAGFRDRDYNASTLTNTASVWVREMKKLGYYPMIYTGYYDIRDLISKDVVNSTDIWLAEWGRYPDYKEKNLGMWQFSDGDTDFVENRPIIPSVGVAVDKNICYKDYPTIIKSGGYNGFKKSDSTPTQKTEDTVTAEKVLSIARAEIGTKATAVKKCKYNTAFYGYEVSASWADWCAVFIWWIFNQAGAADLLFVKTAGCGVLGNAFYTRNKFKTSGFKPGDIVFFHWSDERSESVPITYSLDHVGIIEKVNSDGTVTTIEGNTGDSPYGEVMRRTRSLSVISGVARPDYGASSSGGDSEPTPTPYDGSAGIKEVQSWLNSNYGSGLSVDGVFGPLTNTALIRALQTVLNRQYGANLAVDGIFGSATKKSIRCLEICSQGDYTRVLQGFLICRGLDTGGFDGDFGYMTKSAVLTFQTTANIDADGIAGPETFYRLANG